MEKFIPIIQDFFKGVMYECVLIIDNGSSVRIELDEGDSRVTVIFDDALVVRRMDEGDMLRTLTAIAETGGTGKMLYSVEESTFLNWFLEESYDIRSADALKHFLLAGINIVVDVIAFEEPRIIEGAVKLR